MGSYKVMIQKANYSYVFTKESITVFPNNNQLGQYVSFNCYSSNSRKNFNKFSRALKTSGFDQYDSMNDIFGLARAYEITSTYGHRPTVVNNKIAF